VNKGLLGEVLRMALETLRGNKLRSGLTVLGVVIGITSIVGMTSLIRGFDSSLRASIEQLGPNTIFLSKLSIVSISGGAEFDDLLRRPTLTVMDAQAIERLAPSVKAVDIMVGQGFDSTTERAFYRGERTVTNEILGVGANLGALVGARMLEAHAASRGQLSFLAAPMHIGAIAAFAIAAHLDHLRTERRAPPIDAPTRERRRAKHRCAVLRRLSRRATSLTCVRWLTIAPFGAAWRTRARAMGRCSG